MKSKKLRTIFFIFLLLILVGGIFSYTYLKSFFRSNVSETSIIYIPTGSNYSEVIKILKPHLKSISEFEKMAKLRGYNQQTVKAGKYKLKAGESSFRIVQKLKNGSQEEVNIQFKSYDNIYQLAGEVGKKLECDSTQIINYLKKQAQEKGFEDVDEMKIYFHPDTYSFYWNTSAEKLFHKFEKIHTEFWTEERVQQAKQLGFTPLEATVLASIVQREYAKNSEISTIAGLYINRLHNDMRLQSDPTVIYAKKQAEGFNLKIKRVLRSDSFISSPYNTYRNKGLPPLPICIPSDLVLEKTLQAEKHNYLYMCGTPDMKGHLFTSNFEEHTKNAKIYQQWLNSKNIKR